MTTDQQRTAFERVYERLFRLRGVDTKHMADCEEIWNAALAASPVEAPAQPIANQADRDIVHAALKAFSRDPRRNLKARERAAVLMAAAVEAKPEAPTGARVLYADEPFDEQSYTPIGSMPPPAQKSAAFAYRDEQVRKRMAGFIEVLRPTHGLPDAPEPAEAPEQPALPPRIEPVDVDPEDLIGKLLSAHAAWNDSPMENETRERYRIARAALYEHIRAAANCPAAPTSLPEIEPGRWLVAGHLNWYRTKQDAERAAWLLSPEAGKSLAVFGYVAVEEARTYGAACVAADRAGRSPLQVLTAAGWKIERHPTIGDRIDVMAPDGLWGLAYANDTWHKLCSALIGTDEAAAAAKE